MCKTRAFSDKVTPDTDIKDEAVVQLFHSSSYKNHFFSDDDMQIIANNFWCEYLTYCF